MPITAGRRLRTVRGTVAEIIDQADDLGDDYLRVYVREPARAGLREEVTDVLPNALEVRIDPEFAASATATGRRRDRAPAPPAELFAEFCAAENVADPRVQSAVRPAARRADHRRSGRV